MTYRLTVGLEIHAELATDTKMFCSCRNDADVDAPNVNVCPVCLAHPGTLPVANREAVRQVLRVGKALGGTLADYSEFDRKSYFYPDIPKGYQISQFAYPFVSGGMLAGVPITRVHLEEDTARSSHTGSEGGTVVDFNRAGVPLMELVTEPEIHDAKTAGDFARELQLLLRTLGASHANLEKGEMRVEANISVSKDDTLGTKVEVKNLNSFRSVERAIAYEMDRHIKALETGEKIIQETRGWDENKQQTFSQRVKEGSADYRYFPEPDLPKLLRSDIPEWSDDALSLSLPELPWERRARYESLGMKLEDAAFIAGDADRAVFFDTVIESLHEYPTALTLAGNYFVSDLSGLAANAAVEGKTTFGKVAPESFANLVRMTSEEKLSSRATKDVLSILYMEGGDPETIASEKGLLQVSDPEMLRESVQSVLAANTDAVAEYHAGKESSVNYLLGQAMKAARGAGNPTVLRELILEELAK